MACFLMLQPVGVFPFGAEESFQTALLKIKAEDGRHRASAVREFYHMAARHSNIEPRLASAPIGLNDERLFDYPLLILSGSGPVAALSDSERVRLKRYLSAGGTLVVNNENGVRESEFVVSVKRELSKAFLDLKFKTPPNDHSLFQSYYLLSRIYGRTEVADPLEILEIDSRAAVFVFQNDLLGCFERDELGNWVHDVGGGDERRFAFRTALNLAYYILTKDYKKDQIHLRFIVERRRI